MPEFRIPQRVSLRWLPLILAVSVGIASADPINWQSLQISTIQSTGGFGISFANLPDGRFVLGQQQKILRQNTFGAAASTQIAANGITFDPSFVAVRSATSALLGQGGSFGAVSGLHPFNPTNPTAGTGGVRPAFATQLQTYVAAYWHSPTSSLEGWLIGGANGPSGPVSGHNVTFVSIDGTKSGAVTDELCTYSAGLATDASGNLYAALYELAGSLGAADADKVIRFTASQLEPKIQAIINGTPAVPLPRSAAIFVHKFRSASSIAVDGLGRVWAGGFKVTDVEVYDPATGKMRVVLPTHPAIFGGGGPDTCQVSSFTVGGVKRVGVLAYDSWMFSDTPVYFVHAPAFEVTMPSTTTFFTWRIGKFGADALTLDSESTQWGENADPDQDGLSNLAEYGLDTLPLASNAASPVTTSQSGGLLSLSFVRNPLNTDLTYTVQVSSTLAANDWTSIASSTSGNVTVASGASAVSEVAEGALKRVTVTDANSALGATHRFMRLQITLTPQ